jgi:6-phosphogluconolactonase
MPEESQVRIFASPDELFHGAAEELTRVGGQAITRRGRLCLALSGGSTPRGLHQELVRSFRSSLAWEQVFFFWSDERHVPPTDADSNYRMADETLLSKLAVPADHVCRIPAELADAQRAAANYEESLRAFFRPAADGFPRFDFVVLGVGGDGHTASLFPGTAALKEQKRWVVANWVEKLHTFRITFTYPLLNHAARVMFLVSGVEKADIVRKALKEPAADLPCQRVRPHDGGLEWFLDKGAAMKL